MVYYGVGEDALRAENIDKAIRNIVQRAYVMKQLVMTPTSKAWTETYYRETQKNLASLQGIPRGAAFPVDTVEWEKISNTHEKHGIEAEILEEDVLADNMDVIQRTILRMGNAIARSVDIAIWNKISEDQSAVNINTLATSAAWDNATRANRIPHEDVAEAISVITEQENAAYKPDFLVCNPNAMAYLLSNDYVMDSVDASGPSIMGSGKLKTLLGLKLIETAVATSDYALIGQSKVCATWRTLSPLKTARKYDEGRKYTLRAWETGVAFVTDPKALCLITNTKA